MCSIYWDYSYRYMYRYMCLLALTNHTQCLYHEPHSGELQADHIPPSLSLAVE